MDKNGSCPDADSINSSGSWRALAAARNFSANPATITCFGGKVTGVNQGKAEVKGVAGVVVFDISGHQEIGPLPLRVKEDRSPTPAAASDFTDQPLRIADETERVRP